VSSTISPSLLCDCVRRTASVCIRAFPVVCMVELFFIAYIKLFFYYTRRRGESSFTSFSSLSKHYVIIKLLILPLRSYFIKKKISKQLQPSGPLEKSLHEKSRNCFKRSKKSTKRGLGRSRYYMLICYIRVLFITPQPLSRPLECSSGSPLS
jgi:hypothetical protein